MCWISGKKKINHDGGLTLCQDDQRSCRDSILKNIKKEINWNVSKNQKKGGLQYFGFASLHKRLRKDNKITQTFSATNMSGKKMLNFIPEF